MPQTDLFNKPVPVTINGEETTLLFNANAHIEFQDATDVNLLAMLQSMADGVIPPIKVLRALIWASLLAAKPNIKQKDVGEWLTLRLFKELSPSIGQALKQYMPEIEASSDDRPMTAPTTTEANSSEAASSIGASSTGSLTSSSD